MSREEEDQLEREPDDEQEVSVAASSDEAVDVAGDSASLEVQDGDAASYDSHADANVFADAEDDEEDDEDDDEEDEVIIHDADAEDAAEKLAAMRREMAEKGVEASGDDGEIAPGGSRSMAELISIIESLIFVSEEPLPSKTLADVLKEDRGWVQVAVEELAKEFNERNGGLMLREVAGGWQFATRPENHEHVRAFLKSRPSAKLSLAALETLAVIAYKQPITVPEILEIRGVQSSSAIKTLLDKRLIISKGRKETVGRPMMYGTSKEFLLQFGLRDLSELPNVEDFEDLATGGA
ncbi:MAG TPA: SMC-Scp complex subunit ScpB [Pyrinomonadaceae bacterium]|nr:SMC-Scp complex subunit ScpB [Pyrinomonadaceae bacterium]